MNQGKEVEKVQRNRQGGRERVCERENERVVKRTYI